MNEDAKRAAGEAAASCVTKGMKVGLGTGSTVRYAIEALGAAGLDLTCVATSSSTETLAAEVGLTLVTPDEALTVDVCIDGADEVDVDLNLTKGGGGAHTREKVVASMADRFVVVVDRSKLVPKLGPFGTPVEALPFAPGVVGARLENLGAQSVDHVGTTDNGGALLRAHFGEIEDVGAMAAAMAAIPGLVEHGLFPSPMVASVVVADADGSIEVLGDPLGP